MSAPLPVGKLPAEILGRLLSTLDGDDRVLLGPGLGRDAAAVRIADRILVLKTDPITFATDEIGWYAVHVNANDIACLGATPRWLLVTALLPEDATTSELVERIFADLRKASAHVGVHLVGGHTEITAGLDRPILVGCMVGEAGADELVDPRRARPGDAVILARGIGIEGTALLARELAERLRPSLDEDLLQRAQTFLHEPGISVVAAAAALRQALGDALHAMHDPTEGGLATGLRELAAVAGSGIIVDRAAIFVHPETSAVCAALGVDPLGLISSGAILAVVAPERRELAVSALLEAGIPAAPIGWLTETPELLLRDGDQTRPLPEFAVDEVARLLAAPSP